MSKRAIWVSRGVMQV